MVRIDPDLDVVLPQSVPSTPQAAFYESYRDAAGAQPAHAVATGATAAMVAVVDTVGHNQGSMDYASAPRRLRHGLSIASMIRSIRCPKGDSTCEAKILHTQAFPYQHPNPNPNPNGGVLGSQGALAQAIAGALLRWRTHHAGTRLVVNLSVAWDPSYNTLSKLPTDHMKMLDGNDKTVPVPVQAVHAAIAWGACEQALFVAAAGNHDGDPCGGTGTMVPASWAVYQAPTAKQCTKYFGTPGSDALNGKGELVYAVAGVDYHDQPISNSRAQSLPTRAAAGFMGTGRTGSGHTDNWTGTSVAAATLSGIAARLWTEAPQLSPHELMVKIDGSGTDLNLTPDLRGYGSSATRVRKIQAYGALAQNCGSNPGGCNPYRVPVAGRAWSGVSAAFQQQPLFAATGAPPNALQCVSTEVECGGQTVARTTCDEPAARRRPR
ncbi:MAG: S8/S53 family peptidase, partial [Nannocystaceae bacterium]